MLNDTFADPLGYPLDHQAVLAGNNTTGWTYMSKDGAVGGGPSGPSRWTELHFSNLSQALKAPALARYEQAYRTTSTPAQDKAIVKQGTAEIIKDYNVLNCNCGNAVSNALHAGGIKFPNDVNPSDTVSYMKTTPGWTSVPLPTQKPAAPAGTGTPGASMKPPGPNSGCFFGGHGICPL